MPARQLAHPLKGHPSFANVCVVTTSTDKKKLSPLATRFRHIYDFEVRLGVGQLAREAPDSEVNTASSDRSYWTIAVRLVGAAGPDTEPDPNSNGPISHAPAPAAGRPTWACAGQTLSTTPLTVDSVQP